MKLIFAFFALALSAYSQTVLPLKTDATGLVVSPVTSSAFKTANSIGGGAGTVTSVSVTTANGVSGTVATSTSTPAITLSLGAIVPTSVNGVTLSGAGGSAFTLASGKTFTVSNTLTLAGTNSTTMTFPTTSATIARTDTTNTFIDDQNFSANIIVTGAITAGATAFMVDGAGNVVAPFFAGDGNALTNLTATNITGTTGAGRNLMGIGTPGSTSFVQLSSIGAASTRTIAQTISDLGMISGNKTATGTATTTFTVTFGVTLSGTGYEVQVTPTSLVAAAVFYVTNKTTTTFDVVYLAGLTGSVTFDWLITQ